MLHFTMLAQGIPVKDQDGKTWTYLFISVASELNNYIKFGIPCLGRSNGTNTFKCLI